LDLVVRTHRSGAPGAQEVEVVERKGLGHPDTICDALAEHVCVRLCRHYVERFGAILHHNVDKILLCGGAARPAFGGGEVVEPIEIHVAGRATREHRGVSIPVDAIAVEACREWLQRSLPALDVDRHVRLVPHLRPGSADLTGLFGRQGAVPLANDTSCGAGFAPLTPLERIVLEVEQQLNAHETKRAHPALGTDVKIMGVRRGGAVRLTVGCAMIGRWLRDAGDYVAKRAVAREVALGAARGVAGVDVEVAVNAADDVDRGDLFLTVTGTSAEAGDDGEAGRGNRTCGLITPYRPMTLEAAAGKNPVTHVGKLYNLVASRIAATIAAELPAIADVACVLVSQIGRPVTDPQVVDVRLTRAAGGRGVADVRGRVADVVHGELARLGELRDALLAGRVRVY
jgi:S-adenosylmethionine synthetase